jgi:hypothetical protein
VRPRVPRSEGQTGRLISIFDQLKSGSVSASVFGRINEPRISTVANKRIRYLVMVLRRISMDVVIRSSIERVFRSRRRIAG